MYYISSTFVPSTYYKSENKCNEYPKQEDILYVTSFQYIFIILKKKMRLFQPISGNVA